MDEDAPALDDGIPSMARVFDWCLGGTAHTVVDREFAAAALDVFPGLVQICRDLRVFSRTVVGHLAGLGIDQFVDLGSGIPTERPVHEVAPGARVVYVDVEERTVEHARRLLAHRPGAVAVHGDVRDVGAILGDPAFRTTIDLGRPVGLLAIGVLHYVDGDAAQRALRDLADVTVRGSVVAMNAMTDLGRPDVADWVAHVHRGLSYPPALRTPEDMAPWFAGWEVLPPGWVSAPHWLPDDGPVPGPAETRSGHWGVVARRL